MKIHLGQNSSWIWPEKLRDQEIVFFFLSWADGSNPHIFGSASVAPFFLLKKNLLTLPLYFSAQNDERGDDNSGRELLHIPLRASCFSSNLMKPDRTCWSCARSAIMVVQYPAKINGHLHLPSCCSHLLPPLGAVGFLKIKPGWSFEMPSKNT